MMDALSQLLAAMRPHARVRAQASAYVDGELTPPTRDRFETHLLQCEECARAVAAARAVKTLLAALPTAEAPRSFRLTPQMVSAPAVAAYRPGSAASLRFAQAATALAVFALIAVVSAGVLGSSSSGSTTSAQSGPRNSNESKDAGQKAVAATAASSSGSVSGRNVATPAVGAVAVPQAAADRSAAEPPPASGQPPTAGAFGYASPEALRDSAPARDQPPSRNDISTGDGMVNRRWLELALVIVIVAAGAVWLRLSRTTRRNDP